MSIDAKPVSCEDFEALFNKAKAGDQNAYYQLFDRHIKQLLFERHFSQRQYLYFDTMDLFNEIYLVSWKDFRNVRSVHSFHKWLGVVAMSTYCKMLRKATPWIKQGCLLVDLELVDVSLTREERSILEELGQKESIDYLNKSIQAISEDDQKFISLLYFSELPHQTISEMLNYADTSALYKRRKVVLKRLQIEFQRQTGNKVPIDSFNYLFAFLGTGTLGSLVKIEKGGFLSSLYAGLKSFMTQAGFLTVIPLIWITAVMICGNKVVKTMVNHTSSISNRIWLIRRAFIGYCAVALSPVAVVAGLHFFFYTTFLNASVNTRLTNANLLTATCTGVTFLAFFIISRYQYKKVSATNNKVELSEETIAIAKNALRKMVNVGSLITGVCILVGTLYYSLGLNNLSPKYSFRFLIEHNIDHFVQIIVLYMGYHILTFITFRKIIANIDSDSQRFVMSNGETPVLRSISSAFILATILFPVLNLIFIPDRMPVSLYKLLVFVPWWVQITHLNKRKYRFWLIAVTFVLQMIIIRIF